MEESLHLEWCLLRQCTSQRRLEDFRVESIMNVACFFDIASRELLVGKRTTKHVIYMIVFLAVPCHGDGCAQNLTHFSSPEVFQAFQLRGLKHGDEHRLVHLTRMAPNRLSSNCSRASRRLKAGLKQQPQNKLLRAGIVELKAFAELQGAEQLDK